MSQGITTRDASPSDALICATIDGECGWQETMIARPGVAWAASMAFLYGGNIRRASAALTRLVRAGLVQRVDGRVGSQGYALTPSGLALAATVRPACRGCAQPVEPGLDAHFTGVCRDCLVALYEDRAAEKERLAEFEMDSAQRSFEEAEDLGAHAVDLAEGRDV